jgi:hypothetical protein
MASIKKSVQIAVFVSGLGLVAPVVFPTATAVLAQSPRYEGARQVISRTQVDLERAASFLSRNHNKDEEKRVRNAQKNLSQLDRHFAKGKFDKGTLDTAIGNIQSILDHNVLQSEDRDVLMRDVSDLRAVRADRG